MRALGVIGRYGTFRLCVGAYHRLIVSETPFYYLGPTGVGFLALPAFDGAPEWGPFSWGALWKRGLVCWWKGSVRQAAGGAFRAVEGFRSPGWRGLVCTEEGFRSLILFSSMEPH